ncbi:hypothetical protein GCM10020221_32360 [Streptomyces thioluteus]|uniref:Uncharacterized protein n=1 Tax=Streptomyces thioluteus TaxID=66431 RepID=A0ABN3X0V7_STRTU
MVPPEVTARRWAPGRPVTVPATRSQTRRGAQLGEGVGGIAAGEHVEHAVVGGLREGGEGGRAAHQGQQLPDVPGVHGRHGDDLLGQHVQRIGGHPQGLDGPLAHPLRHDRRLHQVAPVLGEDDAGGDGAHLVSGAADPLQAGGDRRRRLDLDDQVDGAHVDAQLQAGGGHDGGQPAGLEILLDLGALLLGDRAVVRAGQHRRRAQGGAGLGHQLGRGVVLGQWPGGRPLVRDLVEPVAQPLRQAAGVGEDDRGAVGQDEIGDALLDVRPDGGPLPLVPLLGGGGAQLAQILHRDDDREVELLVRRRLDDLHPALRRQIARHLLHRAHGGGQADAPGGAREQGVQPLQGQGQVRAALRPRDGVHLVEDDGLHAGERLPGRGGEHQEQRLGRGDEDVRRAGGQGAALGGRGVAGADADADLRLRQAQAHGLLADAGERAAQIALDVHREGLERGDIQHAAALGALGRRRGARQPVQRGEEGGEGLAGAGGCDDQDVRPLGDGPPGAGLRGRGRGEGAREPGAGRGGEAGEGRMSVPRRGPCRAGRRVVRHAPHRAPGH